MEPLVRTGSLVTQDGIIYPLWNHKQWKLLLIVISIHLTIVRKYFDMLDVVISTTSSRHVLIFKSKHFTNFFKNTDTCSVGSVLRDVTISEFWNPTRKTISRLILTRKLDGLLQIIYSNLAKIKSSWTWMAYDRHFSNISPQFCKWN